MSATRLLIAIVAAVSLTALVPAAPADGPDERPSLVLLTNGRVLEGQIRRDEDRLVVVFPSGEIRLRRDEVLAICRDLDEAYHVQRRKLQRRDFAGHVELAEWCLRHRLSVYAAEETAAARELAPRHPAVALLARKLAAAHRPAVEVDPEVARAESQEPARPAGAPAEAIAAISAEAMDQFTIKIQPLVVNGCSAASCHGPKSSSSFRLIRPPAHRPILASTTQSNLRAVLALVDDQNPEASPLVTVPLAPHGTARRAIFGKPEQEQYRLLLAWTRQVVGKAAADKQPEAPARDAAGPFTSQREKDRRESPPSQPDPSFDGLPPTANVVNHLQRRVQQNSKLPQPPASPSPGDRPKKPSPPSAYQPRDPFDAELFNRRFFPQKGSDPTEAG